MAGLFNVSEGGGAATRRILFDDGAMKRLFYRIMPSLIIAALLFNAVFMFTLKYYAPNAIIPILMNENEILSRTIYLRNFYISFTVYVLALFGGIFFLRPVPRYICLIAGLMAAVLGTYILEDLFSINLFIYLAYIIMVSLIFPPPKNILCSVCGILLFGVFVHHPRFMGLSLGGAEFSRPSFAESYTALFVLFLAAVVASLTRFFIDKYLYNQETIRHLNSVSAKLLLFNHRLQNMTRQRGEEAVKQDRLRFTRDIHDSCGYAFSNIILVSDAAVSRGTIEAAHSQEIFHQIRSLASRGLNETRETLHLIRRLQEPYQQSIETVYRLKEIFEEVTGITVDIEWGNMKHDYGTAITKVLTRIIQEAFTNSIRHGKATRILIHFWEFPQPPVFTMTVTDNGIGASNIVKGIGLAGMEERLESVGGTLAAYSVPEGGFRLKIVIPLLNPA
jgi:signal transduction histidine kinase